MKLAIRRSLGQAFAAYEDLAASEIPELAPESSAVAVRPLHVFLADDDRASRTRLAEVLRADGHTVTESDDGTALTSRLESALGHGEIDDDNCVVLSSLFMPGKTGMHVLRWLAERSGSAPFVFPPVILVTTFGDPLTHARARGLGATAVLDKPVDLRVLRRALDQIAALSARPCLAR